MFDLECVFSSQWVLLMGHDILTYEDYLYSITNRKEKDCSDWKEFIQSTVFIVS